MLKVLVLIITYFIPAVFGANILAVFPVPSISHQIVYRTLTLELNKRGHNLTVITPNPMKNLTLKNYHEIDVSFQYKLWNKEMINPKIVKMLSFLPEAFIAVFTTLAPDMCHSYFSNKEVADFIKSRPKFDLLITEFGVLPCVYAFSRFTGYRHIGITSFQTNVVVHSNFGNPSPGSYIPDIFLPYSNRMSFLERLRTTLFHAFVWTTYSYTMWSQTKIVRLYFGKETPHLIDIERNLSALLVNSHFSVSYPRVKLPNLVEIGGPAFHLSTHQPKPLPKEPASVALYLIFEKIKAN